MQVESITMERERARELYRAYKTHINWERPEEYDIMRTYQLIAQGHVIVRALESIKQAGLNEKGYPKLAIARASAKWCHFRMGSRGDACFSDDRPYRRRGSRDHIEMPDGSFGSSTKYVAGYQNVRAMVPLIPPQHRPKRALENYHILWEAEWEKTPPVDPYLLRRIGKTDMWMVLAAWDLTPVERAVMRTKMLVM